MSSSELRAVAGTQNQNRVTDVVFIHGLDGDLVDTWQAFGEANNFWPRWLSDDLPDIGVWSFGYPSSSISWRGTSMPLVDRALNALSFFEAEGVGTRPIFFVTHSLGGLLAKQILRQADGLGKPEWNRVARQTKGIVFLSTPNSGSRIANWVMHFKSLVRATVSIEELQDNDPRLRDLNLWFRNNVGRLAVDLDVYCEKQPVGPFIVVDETSADIGLPGIIPTPLDENHITIAKPRNRQSLLYKRVRNFIGDRMPKYPRSFAPLSGSLSPRRLSDANDTETDSTAELRLIAGPKANEINSLAWSPTGHYLSVASDDCTVRIWNPEIQGTQPPTQDEHGFSRNVDFNHPSRMAYPGALAWCREDRLAEVLGRGRQIFYAEDGKYLKVLGSDIDQILVSDQP